MLLDLPTILIGVGVAVVGFVVVLAFCIVVLRLLTVVLPPGPRSAEGDVAEAEIEPEVTDPEAGAETRDSAAG